MNAGLHCGAMDKTSTRVQPRRTGFFVRAADYPLRMPMRWPLLWRISLVSVALGVALARVEAYSRGAAWGTWPTLLVMGTAAGAALLSYFLMMLRAGEGGLLLFNSWGVRRHVGWDEVRQAGLRRMPWLLFAPALALELHDGRRYWLPRDTQNLAALHALALRLGGPAHPLLRVLETPLHAL